jgi:hypothetical protein
VTFKNHQTDQYAFTNKILMQKRKIFVYSIPFDAFYDQLSDGSIFLARSHLNSCCSVHECSKVVKLHMEIAPGMYDHQKPAESLYEQGKEEQQLF